MSKGRGGNRIRCLLEVPGMHVMNTQSEKYFHPLPFSIKDPQGLEAVIKFCFLLSGSKKQDVSFGDCIHKLFLIEAAEGGGARWCFDR